MRRAVRRTVELDRIDALPRRRLDPAVADAYADALTRAYALPGSTARLRRWQGQALAELAQVRGAWLAFPVGLGKTLVSFLAPAVVGSDNSVGILPAAMINSGKTHADFAALSRDWRGPAVPSRLISREALALEQNATLLFEIKPTFIWIDESDELSNPEAAAVKRIDRYVAAYSETVVLAMTGTPERKSILNYWHLLIWCLGDGAPVPATLAEAEEWAAALDHRKWTPVLSGALGPTRKVARRWFAERLSQTPGVLIVDGDSCDQPITIRYRFAREAPEMNAAFERFAKYQETPAGVPVTDPLSRWALDGLLGLGLFREWVPPPPDEWRDARRAVAGLVRARIEQTARSHSPLDTEGQVLRRHADHPIVQRWRTVEPTFDGHTEPRWFSRATLDSVADWLRELDGEPGIVWCGSVDFARALARETGLAYHGPDGKAADGSSLVFAPAGQSLIASWQANKKGFNLQAWPRQLIVLPPQSAKWLEQIMGRGHRSGLDRPFVVDILCTSGGTIDCFEEAVAEAESSRERVLLTQKVLRATIERPTPPTTAENRFRWARKGDRDDDNDGHRTSRPARPDVHERQSMHLPGVPGRADARAVANGRERLRLLRAQGRLGQAAI